MNRFSLYSPIYDLFMKLFGFYKEDEIQEELATIKGGSLLDVAGGTGFLMAQYQHRFDRIVIADRTEKMLAIAQKRGLAVCRCSALSLPFDDESFDVIICTDALHHIKEYDLVLPEMHRVLRTGGTILIQEMHIRGLLGMLFYLWEKIWIDNSKFITPEALAARMEKYGFQGRIRKTKALEYFYRGVKKRGYL